MELIATSDLVSCKVLVGLEFVWVLVGLGEAWIRDHCVWSAQVYCGVALGG
jgi:hypothetical protein